MFASTDLAGRIDRAEARLSASLGRAVLAARPGGDAFVAEVAGGVVVYAEPLSPINKMIGVGFDTLPGDDRLQEVEEKFSRLGVPLQAEVSTLANPAFASRLTRRGYVLQGFENVLGRAITPEDADASSSIDIALLMDGDEERWLDAAVTGFLHPDEQGVQAEPLPPRADLERVLRDFTSVKGFLRYCAWVDGRLAGVASLRLDAGLAQLCGAATLPAFRRRGVQTALLHRRLADARHQGCDLALMTTQPGSKSQENGYRQGFTLLYSRALLVKPPEH